MKLGHSLVLLFVFFLFFFVVCSSFGRATTRNLPNRNSIFFFRTEINLHPMRRKMNYRADILRFNTKNENSAKKKIKYIFGPVFLSKIQIRFGAFVHLKMHVKCNRSRPRELVPCRRLTERRECTIARGGTTEAVAARSLKALTTA